MVLKVIDGNVTNIVDRMKSVNLVTKQQESDVEKLITKFNEFRDVRISPPQNVINEYYEKLKNADTEEEFKKIQTEFKAIEKQNGFATEKFKDFVSEIKNFDDTKISKLAPIFEEAAKAGDDAQISIESFFNIILNGNTKGFQNVKNIINTFNSLDTSNQEAFSKAVSNSNKQLGNYLSGLVGSSASLKGYGVQLVGATVKTYGLKIATELLNSAISLGLSFVIQGLISVIQTWIEKENKAREAAVESIKTYEEKADALDDLIEKYQKIVDSEDTEAEKTKQLETFKTDLIEVYGLEKDAVDNLNLSRTEGIELLKQEIEESKKIARQEWLENNGGAITTARDKTNNARRYNNTFNTFTNIDNGDGRNSIRKSIIDLFDDYETVNGELESTISFRINTDNIYEEYDKIKSIMRTMDTIRSKAESAGSGLTDTEEAIYLNLQAHLNSIQTLIDDGTRSIYDTSYRYEALNKLDEYIDDGHSLENVGKQNFEAWRNGLIEQAQGDKELEKALVKVISDTFPALEKSFQNLQSLYNKYLGKSFLSGEASKQADKGIKQFLDSLSDEDLEIATKIPDLFAQGLTGATKKIQEWKNNPANQIQAEDIVKLSLDEMIKANDTKIKLISSAMKEMNEQGYISASTYASLIEQGGNFTQCLEVVNGKLVLNVEKLKNLEKQQLHNLIIDNNIRIGKLNESLAHGANADEIRKETKAIQEQNAVYETMLSELDNAGNEDTTKKEDTSDPVKEAFEKDMKDIEHLHNMGLKSDKEYYDALEKANEKHYKNSADHESDYLSNVEKIYNARQSLYKENADKQFDDLEDQYKRGIITAEWYAQGLYDLGQELYGEDSIYGGTEFAIKALEELDEKISEVTDDIYSAQYDSLEKVNDKTIKSEKDFIYEWSKLANETYKVSNPKKWLEEYSKIGDYTQNYYKDLLDKGLLNPEQYRQKIADFFNKLKDIGVDLGANWLADALGQLSESDYLDAWDLQNNYDSSDSAKNYNLRANRVKYIYDLAEQLYGKNGQKNVKAYNALIKQGLEEEKSIWEDRVDDEKSFWEDRQEEIETYYDAQIDKIKDVQEEENKLKDLEEKRLALIKARQNLENVKNQRNQLIFEGGTFRYDVDQDAILSAEEELADAIEALRDVELNTQIELLEEQKNNAVEFYKKIIDKIDEYLNKDNKVLNSDSEVLNTVLETDAPKANFDMQKFIDGGSNFESLVKALGGTFTQKAADYFKDSYNATLVGKQITPSTVDKVVNNSSNTTNNSSRNINIGDIHVHLELTVKSLEDFVDNKIDETMTKLGNAIQQKMPAIWAKA